MKPEPHSTTDPGRMSRQGFPEVVYCESKTTSQIIDNLRALADANGVAFGTRLQSERANEILTALPDASYHELARTISIGTLPPAGATSVVILSAGTSDLPVASEAATTLGFLGHTVTSINDVGVAGIHRLMDRLDTIRSADVVIVVAGMEGALPSVVGGLVSAPVIAVPTSVGYGAAFGGIAALLGMLNSCASGLTVVNIDNGFGAAMAAHRILGKSN
jgi:NCAIR mutase (PurE)-related protein